MRPRPAAITDRYDFNRDKKVDATDQIIARNHQTTFRTDLKRLQAPLNPVSGLQSQSIDSQTLRLTWQDNSKLETGYSIQLANQEGSYQEVQRTAPGATAANLTGLSPNSAYSLRLLPLAGGGGESGGVATPLPSTAQARSITASTNPLASGSSEGAGWYLVSISGGLSKGEAGYSGNGSASFRDGGLVYASSAEAAIWSAVQGSATITTNTTPSESRTFEIPCSGAFLVGQVSELAEIDGFDKPSGMSDDQWLVVLEDSYEWTNIDEDWPSPRLVGAPRGYVRLALNASGL